MTKLLPVVFGGIDQQNFRFCTELKIIAEDKNCIVGIMEADGQAVNSKRYDQRYVHIFEFDGKISRVMEFFDTALAAETVLVDAAPVAPDGPFQL